MNRVHNSASKRSTIRRIATTISSSSRVGACRGRPCVECLGLGHIWGFLCGFQGASAPFLLPSVVPGLRAHCSSPNKGIGEECRIRWESIFPSPHGENSSDLRRTQHPAVRRKIENDVITPRTFFETIQKVTASLCENGLLLRGMFANPNQV